MSGFILNRKSDVTSLQVSVLKAVPAGNSTFSPASLLKNITDSQVVVSVRPAGQDDFIDTVLYPGWNVELVAEVKGVTEKTLQYGY